MINSRAMLLRGRSLQMPSRWRESLKELEAILEALDRRDPVEAHARAVHHVRKAAEMALKSFD
jgi:DNA-binding GntR family transcriptional regulator